MTRAATITSTALRQARMDLARANAADPAPPARRDPRMFIDWDLDEQLLCQIMRLQYPATYRALSRAVTYRPTA